MTDAIFDAPFVSGLAVWLLITIAVARVVSRIFGSAKIAVVVATVLFIAPIWDLPFGLAMYHKYQRELAGTRIFKTVEAEGYVDVGPNTMAFSPLGFLLFMPELSDPSGHFDSSGVFQPPLPPYAYREVKIDAIYEGGDFITQPGFWVFRLQHRGHPSCLPFETWATAQRLRENHRIPDQWCVVATRRDKPISRFQREFSPYRPGALEYGLTAMPGAKWLPPVLGAWERVVDRNTGEVIAQSYSFHYYSWLPMPLLDAYRPLSWHTGAGPGYIRIKEVIRPTGADFQ